jgi:hypothetical protein
VVHNICYMIHDLSESELGSRYHALSPERRRIQAGYRNQEVLLSCADSLLGEEFSQCVGHLIFCPKYVSKHKMEINQLQGNKVPMARLLVPIVVRCDAMKLSFFHPRSTILLHQ